MTVPDRFHDVVVIGGGQSALAAAFYLRKTGLTYTLLDDQPEPGGAWRHAWPSLTLFSPPQWSSLPGRMMQADGGSSGYPALETVLAYLADYEGRYAVPVIRPIHVDAVRRDASGGFRIDTTAGSFVARAVVSATGTWSNPVVPDIEGRAGFGGIVIHSASYGGPDGFEGKRIVVVGGGNSGAQVVAELSRVARVTWATREPPTFLPDEVDGRYLFEQATIRYKALQAGREPPPPRSLGDVVVVPSVREARDRGALEAVPMFHRFTATGVQWPDGTAAGRRRGNRRCPRLTLPIAPERPSFTMPMTTEGTADPSAHAPIHTEAANVLRRLSLLDRFLPVWIVAAMLLGLGLGRAWPQLGAALDRVKVAGVSVPIGVGLLWMMYPVLAKVRYESIGKEARNPRLLVTSLALNWVIGPILMFVLAWTFLSDMPAYRNGLVLIGLARCIAMVLVWNTLARGSNELAAMLVALNSLFQILTYSVLAWLFLTVVPEWLGAESTVIDVSMADIAKSVLIFLGVPLLAGYLTRRALIARRGEPWYSSVFMPKFGPTALVGLLYTIVLMFAMQGDRILAQPGHVMRIALPMVLYFFLMFGLAFALAKKLGFDYPTTASLSFTAAGNNFELAIAVAVATFGIGSGEALAAVIGPLIEVPVLVGLVYVSLWAGRRFFQLTVV